jgi:DNA-binding MarR family transcriptional regulator
LVGDAGVRSTIAELERAGLLIRTATTPVRVELTDAGHERVRLILAGIGQITARIYGDLPADDLATTRRVLTTVAERARAELAG